jgi:ribosomal protein S18 acetylase RimI-like enzyme
MIRSLTSADIDLIIPLQLYTLPGSLPSKFGKEFMRLYYETLLPEPGFFCDGYFWQADLVGFIVYSSSSQNVLRRAFLGNILSYTRVLTNSLLRSPRRMQSITKIILTLIPGGSNPLSDVSAEMISIGILPDFRGSSAIGEENNKSVASQLLDNGLNVLRDEGVDQVKVYTKLESDSPIANAFVRRAGFQLVGAMQRYDQISNLYLLDLSA